MMMRSPWLCRSEWSYECCRSLLLRRVTTYSATRQCSTVCGLARADDDAVAMALPFGVDLVALSIIPAAMGHYLLSHTCHKNAEKTVDPIETGGNEIPTMVVLCTQQQAVLYLVSHRLWSCTSR